MKQWTEQPDGTWRRGPLVVLWGMAYDVWFWHCNNDSGGIDGKGAAKTREEAQQAADAWAANMLAQLKQLEEPATTNPSQISSSVPQGVRAWMDFVGGPWLLARGRMYYFGQHTREWYDKPDWTLGTMHTCRELHGPELQQVYESWVNRSGP